MDILMEMIGVFAKEKLSDADNDLFLRYRSIQCSKFTNLTFDQDIGDIKKVEQTQ